jgi:hypothetical protein
MKVLKPIKTFEERIKSNFIAIDFFKKAGIYSFSIISSIGDGGIGHPNVGAYNSLPRAKMAALQYVRDRHKSSKQKELLKQFKMLENLEQPELFDE